MGKMKERWFRPEGYQPPTSAEELLKRTAAGERFFRGAKLARAQLDGANLQGVDLGGADLHGATAVGADIGSSGLSDSDLRGVKFDYSHGLGVDFNDADLRGANFQVAHLSHVDFQRANLERAAFIYTSLLSADLLEASLTGAVFGGTTLNDIDLSSATGLGEVEHRVTSSVGTDTLHRTAAGLAINPSNQGAVETFFRGCGLTEDDIAYFRALIGRPIEWVSAFISYSHKDKAFAHRLYDALQGRGIRCWLDEHDMKPGDRIFNVVDQAIRLHDKLLILCSEVSLNSWWVQDEITKALEKERRDGRDIIIPLMLDKFLLDEWEHGLASQVRSRLAADFTDRSHEAFEREFLKVVGALKADSVETPEAGE